MCSCDLSHALLQPVWVLAVVKGFDDEDFLQLVNKLYAWREVLNILIQPLFSHAVLQHGCETTEQ